MGFLNDFFVKKTGDYFSVIKQSVDESTLLLGVFLKIYESKINKIKKLIPLWEGSKITEIKEAEQILDVIPKYNKELQSLINKLLGGGGYGKLYPNLF